MPSLSRTCHAALSSGSGTGSAPFACWRTSTYFFSSPATTEMRVVLSSRVTFSSTETVTEYLYGVPDAFADAFIQSAPGTTYSFPEVSTLKTRSPAAAPKSREVLSTDKVTVSPFTPFSSGEQHVKAAAEKRAAIAIVI